MRKQISHLRFRLTISSSKAVLFAFFIIYFILNINSKQSAGFFLVGSPHSGAPLPICQFCFRPNHAEKLQLVHSHPLLEATTVTSRTLLFISDKVKRPKNALPYPRSLLASAMRATPPMVAAKRGYTRFLTNRPVQVKPASTFQRGARTLVVLGQNSRNHPAPFQNKKPQRRRVTSNEL